MATAAATIAVTLLILAATAAAQLSAHGLTYEKDPGPASPAMLAFFNAKPKVALPEALDVNNRDATTSVVAAPARRRTVSGDSRPSAGVVAGAVIGGVVGFAIVVAVIAVVVGRARGWAGPGSFLGLIRPRAGSEVRLGSV